MLSCKEFQAFLTFKIEIINLIALKKTGLIILFFYLAPNLFAQSRIAYFADLIKDLDKTWQLQIDTSRKTKKSLIIGGQCVGFLTLTKGKEEITYCVYQSLSNNIDSSIRQTQKLASCSVIGLTEKNQIAKRNGLVFFLSIYPCWTEYSDDAKKLIQKTFTKLRG